ncbi:MAG: transposase [Terriglobia bacterium]
MKPSQKVHSPNHTASSPAAPAAGKLKATHKARVGFLFISATTYRRLPLFRYRRPCQIFFENLEFYHRKYNFRLHAYVLMPNHFHLLINFPADRRLADFLRDFKSAVGIQILDWLKTEGRTQLLSRLALNRSPQRRKDPRYAVWQRDSYITPLVSTKLLRQRLNYIHANPIREGLAATPEAYPYSSARAYTGKGLSLAKIDPLELPYD